MPKHGKGLDAHLFSDSSSVWDHAGAPGTSAAPGGLCPSAFEHSDSSTDATHLLFICSLGKEMKGEVSGIKAVGNTQLLCFTFPMATKTNLPVCSASMLGGREGLGRLFYEGGYFRGLFISSWGVLSAQPKAQPHAGTAKGPASHLARACGRASVQMASGTLLVQSLSSIMSTSVIAL